MYLVSQTADLPRRCSNASTSKVLALSPATEVCTSRGRTLQNMHQQRCLRLLQFSRIVGINRQDLSLRAAVFEKPP
ncbi:hypothetical protein VTP01DRAFT_1975 [Rhizomucor pusillus]|uniref:uncharacterized protein n=1 Tax=Rhizomucor pusillus TaxID=4840 RepID=UPI003743CA99